MNFLKGLGGFANGWLKLSVSLIALGWFGLEVVDRVNHGAMQGQAVSSPMPDYVSTENTAKQVTNTSYISPSAPSEPSTTSSFVRISSDITSSAISFFGMVPTQLSFAVLAGFGFGYFGRPKIERGLNREKRELHAAKKRVKKKALEQERDARAAELVSKGLEAIGTSAVASLRETHTQELAAGPRV